MPRIRFVNQYAGIIGGIERYMERTARLLRQNGFTVDCCYAERTQDSERFLAAFDHAESISEAAGQGGYNLTVLHKVRDAATIRALRETGRTAVFIHDHEYYCPRRSYYYPITRKNCSRAYCEFLCGCCAMLRRPAPDNTFHANFGGFSLLWREVRLCGEFIVLSGFMREILVRQGIPEETISLIPPAVTVPPESSPSEAKFPDSIPHILVIGQLIRGKGIDQLLAAMHTGKTPCVLDIVGTGNDEAYLKQLAEPLGSSVVFHGYSPNPDDAFRGVRAVVLPWRWQEPFGLVGPEALAHGVPLVGFDVGAVREYLVDGRTGLLVPPGDTDALAKAIDRLLNAPEEAAAMGLRGRELVSTRFTDNTLLQGWRDFLSRPAATIHSDPERSVS